VASAAPLDRLGSAYAGWAAVWSVVWAAAIWVDRALPVAGVWALLGFSLSTGLVHGALDAQLLLQRFTSRSRALVMAGLYLLAVLAVGATLSRHPGTALFALIAMSGWHFGEGYGRWAPTCPALQTLTRVVVGGAPVLLFPWTVPDGTSAQLLPWLSVDALQTWRGLGLLWLALFLVWSALFGLPQLRAHRHAWAELAGVGLLNLSLSPAMAFALYFGAYHAPVHIWRVWRSRLDRLDQRSTSVPGPTRWWAIAAVVALTILLGATLWKSLDRSTVQPAELTDSVRWLIVALAALTLPHLVLISACARMLLPVRKPDQASAPQAGPR